VKKGNFCEGRIVNTRINATWECRPLLTGNGSLTGKVGWSDTIDSGGLISKLFQGGALPNGKAGGERQEGKDQGPNLLRNLWANVWKVESERGEELPKRNRESFGAGDRSTERPGLLVHRTGKS